MLMHILFSIFTAIYTLVSTTEVEQIGNAPLNSTYTFERTATSGKSGQMTAGNSTTLRLAGWDNSIIRSISLKMHSNSKSGAGSLNVQIGNQIVWNLNNLSFADEQWAGEYTTQWVDIQKDVYATVEHGDLLEISILSSENSLYINSYTIVYESKETPFHTVNFITGLDTYPSPITQNDINAPIILPAWRDTADWHFVGWSEVEVNEQQTIENIYQSGEEYIPDTTCTLWAVYTEAKNNLSVKTYCSGEYIITMRNVLTESVGGSGLAMSGNITQGEVQLSVVEMDTTSQNQYRLLSHYSSESVYELSFYDNETLTIVHSTTGEPIGYNANKLSSILSTWNYRITDDGSLVIYYFYNKKPYVLYFGVNNRSKVVARSQQMDINLWKNDALWLFPTQHNRYTSWPLDYPTTSDDNIEILPNCSNIELVFGTYHIHIRDGKKFLYLNH